MGRVQISRECKHCGFSATDHVVGTFFQSKAFIGDYRKWFRCPACENGLRTTIETLVESGVIDDRETPQEAISAALAVCRYCGRDAQCSATGLCTDCEDWEGENK